MSEINDQEILHIAELAKIHLQPEECQSLGAKLGGILNLVEKMQGIDTRDIEPMTHTIYQNQKLREDITDNPQQRDYYQGLSQDINNGFYLVPKVID